MKIVMFTHPGFMRSHSMPRFAEMLKSGFIEQGYKVDTWTPKPILYSYFSYSKFSKWAGYIDQYVIFPIWVRRNLKSQSNNVIYVFCDQALGPWVPLVKSKPHVVHVHDFMALKSSIGLFDENKTSFSGRIYQQYIKRGFSQAKNFISISSQTQSDLHEYGEVSPRISDIIYNGLNYPYKNLSKFDARAYLDRTDIPTYERFILHVGGSQWYKNFRGVIYAYEKYVENSNNPIPLICISPPPSAELELTISALSKKGGEVLFFKNISDQAINALYSLASVFFFPSLEEGFGWPIIEAQASGGIVLTTDHAPMNEIAGKHSFYLPKMQVSVDHDRWSILAANKLEKIINLPDATRSEIITKSITHAAKFNAKSAIDKYLQVYKRVYSDHKVI